MAVDNNEMVLDEFAAICQIRHPGPGRDYFDKKRAEAKSTKEALRSMKRHISNRVYRNLVNDAQHPAPGAPVRVGPGGHSGTTQSPA